MILDDIVEAKKKRLKEHKAALPYQEVRRQAEQMEKSGFPFYQALKKEGLSIIGEFKKASPSMGKIDGLIPLEQRIEQYNESVDAISCLTEEDYFHGSAEYLKQIRQISPLPILRKDFVIDDYQIYEAKVIEADAILLIAAILTDSQMQSFYALAQSLGLDVLLEVHNEEEIERALRIHPRILGVNNRNLKDFTISLEHTRRLRPLVPENVVFVSESGVGTNEDVAFLKQCRVDALLIGKAFMQSEQPKELAREWKAVYRNQI